MSLPEHLQIDISHLDFDSLLEDWRWLVDETHRPILMSFLGDLFLKASDGSVLFLDLMSGSFQQVAASEDEFNALLKDRERRRSWVPGFLYSELKAKQGPLETGECYSCEIPLTLGGTLEPENFRRVSIAVHYSILGQLQAQVRNLAPGAKIRDVRIRDETVTLVTDQKRIGFLSRLTRFFP